MEAVPQGVLAETTEVAGVALDSRKIEKGYVFVATVGERVDGHSFIDSVFDKGALGVVCEKAPENPKGAYILVEDSFKALRDMAELYMEGLSTRVVGITGSVGKTSTKEFVASVLSQGFRVQKTQGNFNNEVGLPLTVLDLKEDCEIAVLEMGISDFGEMHRLSKIAKPDICVITNIGQCHLENLGTRDGILKAKSEIFDFMKEGGRGCLNGDDDKLSEIKEVRGVKPVFFSANGAECAVYASDCENKGLDGSSARIHINIENTRMDFPVDIPLPGAHMIYNALAAATVGALLGLSAEQISLGIKNVAPVGGRSNIIHSERFTVIDDCYNANPVSVKAALDLLEMSDISKSPRRVAILGDMFELGADEERLHADVGRYAADKDIQVLICTGKLSRCTYEAALSEGREDMDAYYFEDKAALLGALDGILHDRDTVLVKASHGMGFAEVVEVLR